VAGWQAISAGLIVVGIKGALALANLGSGLVYLRNKASHTQNAKANPQHDKDTRLCHFLVLLAVRTLFGLAAAVF
jgi:hypothetical protein